MRVRGDEALAAHGQYQRRAAWAVERLTMLALPNGVPRDDHTECVVRAEAVELFEPEGKVADRRPDTSPLLALEALTSRNDRGERIDSRGAAV